MWKWCFYVNDAGIVDAECRFRLKVRIRLPDESQKRGEWHQAENNRSMALRCQMKLVLMSAERNTCHRGDLDESGAPSTNTSAHPIHHNPLQLAVSTPELC